MPAAPAQVAKQQAVLAFQRATKAKKRKPRYGNKEVTDDSLAARTAQRRNALLNMGVKPKVSASGLDTTTGGEARALKEQLSDARKARKPIKAPKRPGSDNATLVRPVVDNRGDDPYNQRPGEGNYPNPAPGGRRKIDNGPVGPRRKGRDIQAGIKNYGQQRRAEVHRRNAILKDAKRKPRPGRKFIV